MTQLYIPIQTQPVIYTQEQMEQISPQIDQLIEQCNMLIQKGTETSNIAYDCLEKAQQAERQLSEPLHIENRVYEAKYAVKQLQKKLGKLPPRVHYDIVSGHCTILGKRPSNEDAHVIDTFVHNERKFTIAAVFDGHAGDRAAIFCAEHFKEYLMKQESFPFNIQKALRQTFIEMDADFCKNVQQSGCTATALVYEHNADNVLYTANAGDARILYKNGNMVTPATIDHKPSSEKEKQRIEAAGSFVTTIFGIARVAGQLAVSRAIGDYDYKQFGVTAEPETYAYEDLDELSYIILACDGLYDVMSNEEIDFAVSKALGFPVETTNDRTQLIGDSLCKYVAGKVKEADEALMQYSNQPFINFKACVEPTQQMSLEDRITTSLTRIAFLIGSMDNITCCILNTKEVEE